MSELKIARAQIPLWTGSEGAFAVTANVPSVNAPLTPGADRLVAARFDIEGGKDVALGGAGGVKIGVQANTSVALQPLWREQSADADVVKKYGLGAALTGDNLLLALQVGAGADVAAEGSYRYGVLTAGATLAAGAEAGFVQVRSYPRDTPLLAMVTDFFGRLALPGTLTRPPGPGELVAFEFAGYLDFGLSASAGYEIKGTHSAAVSQIKLSEHYQLAVVGKLAVQARAAGRYGVVVRAGERPGWARVTVRRARAKELRFAADVAVDASVKTEGLPPSGKEFLGALLGVEARNWLNLIDSAVDAAGDLASPDALRRKLDGLAQAFFEKWLGKGLDALMTPAASEVLARLQKVARSYRELEASAVALFDRFYDPVARGVGALAAQLEELKGLVSWDHLGGEVDPLLWNVVRQLTDGDPIGWALGRVPGTSLDSLTELKRRAAAALDLIRNEAHEAIRELIHVAKAHFALDSFLGQLAEIDSPEKLKELVGSRLGHFLTRLTGIAIDKTLSNKEVKAVLEIARSVAGAKDAFWEKFDHVLEQAAAQSLKAGVHAAYRRAEESDALIDVEIKLLESDGQPNTAGQSLMRSAGSGDFAGVLSRYQPDVVRLHDGVLTHRLSRETALKINVVGWHLGYQYEAAHRVIVDAQQRIRSSDAGLLTVLTTVDLEMGSDQRRVREHEERVHAQFLLRFLGDTKVVSGEKFDDRDKQYAIDVITGRSAAYDLTFTDAETTRPELEEYLAFAADLGLDQAGATFAALAPVLERHGDHFGRVEAEYAVRFTAAGVEALNGEITEASIRRVLRRIVIGRYAGAGTIASVGWLFCSDGAQALYEKNRMNFVNADSVLAEALGRGQITFEVPVRGLKPGPIAIRNTREIRILAASLFDIQRVLIDAFHDLQKLLRGTQIPVAELERGLSRFGEALEMFDRRDMSSHSVFAVFDGLIQLRTAGSSARSSSLTLRTVKEGRQRTAVFVVQASS
jgi:hypothetical protein